MSLLFLLMLLYGAAYAKCPNGDNIIRRGVTNNEKEKILTWHNKYREKVLNGQIPFQPQGIDLLPLSWDDYLASNAQFSTSSCRYEVRVGFDVRYKVIGQNIMKHKTFQSAGPDWDSVIFEWFHDYEDYLYPGNNRQGLNYAQVVWANTTIIGCDYLEYLSRTEMYSYVSLYVCNYAPGGNIQGRVPYKIVE